MLQFVNVKIDDQIGNVSWPILAALTLGAIGLFFWLELSNESTDKPTVNRLSVENSQDRAQPAGRDSPTLGNSDSIGQVVDSGPTTESSTMRLSLVEGEEFDVHLRPRQRVAVARPAVLADELEAFKMRAESGEGSVARALSNWLNRCNGRNFATDAEFEDFLDHYQQTHTLPVTIQNQRVDVRKEPNSQIVDELKSDFEFCKAVPDSDIEASEMWLVAAAEAGNVDALMEMGRNHVGRGKGLKYLEESWLAGSIDGAGWLAKAYATQSNPEDRDFVSAYAYQKVYATIVRTDFERRGVADLSFNQSWMEADSAGLQNFSNQLNPSQLEAANSLAARILRENGNCCFERR